MTIKDNPIDTRVDERLDTRVDEGLMRLVREFFIRRFKRQPETDLGYFNEWVERFETGFPERYMDSESLYIYNEIIRERESKP